MKTLWLFSVFVSFCVQYSGFSLCNRWFHFFNDDPANWIPAGVGVYAASKLIAVSEVETN